MTDATRRPTLRARSLLGLFVFMLGAACGEANLKANDEEPDAAATPPREASVGATDAGAHGTDARAQVGPGDERDAAMRLGDGALPGRGDASAGEASDAALGLDSDAAGLTDAAPSGDVGLSTPDAAEPPAPPTAAPTAAPDPPNQPPDGPPVGGGRYRNPVIGAGDHPKDPQLMRAADGTFYLFHPDDRRYEVYASADLVEWRHLRDPAFRKDTGSFWSAGTYVRNGTYNLYYTHVEGARDRTIGVATSDTPEGPYRDANARLVVRKDADDRFLPVIDPSVFRDPETDRVYLYYARNVGTGTPPDLRVVELAADGLSTIAGTDRQVLTITQDWERVNIEHPLVFHAPNAPADHRYYMLYNGAGGALARYAIGYAYAASPRGPFTKAPAGDAAGRNPLVKQNAAQDLYGPGAPNTVVDANGARWLLYRIKTTADEAWGDRAISLDPMFRNARDQLECTPTRGVQQVGPVF
jgi:hypothetical protein